MSVIAATVLPDGRLLVEGDGDDARRVREGVAVALAALVGYLSECPPGPRRGARSDETGQVGQLHGEERE